MNRDERYRLLVESIDGYAIYLVDADGRIESWNIGAERLTGYAAVEAVGMKVSELYPSEEEANALADARTSCRTGRGVHDIEGSIRRRDGSAVSVAISVQPVRNELGEWVGCAEIARDLSRRAALAKESWATEEQFRRLVNGVVDYAIYMLDLGGHVHSWNLGAERIKGYRAEEIIGQHFSVFYTDSDLEKGMPDHGLAQALEHGRFENQAWRVRKDGSLFWAHVVIDRVDDGDGTPVGFAKVTRDATESRRAQEAMDETRRALHQAQKMEAIGHLTGGVAHDFNNLLQVISGNLQLLSGDVSGNDAAQRRVANAMAGVARGSKLASQLLAFGRRQPLAPKVVNPGKLLREMDDLLRHTLGESVEIETVVGGGLWSSLIDRVNLENAILNLSINARDAMGGHGKLTLEAGNAFLDDRYALLHEEIRPGQYVLISVTDNGCGIPPALLEKVFEPFFSTKSEGNGTGLGLSMVYGFVKQSGGHIKIYSEVGHGTTVKLYIPRTTEVEEQATSVTISPLLGGTESILVVEDDEDVRETTVSLLRNLGYSVLQAANPDSALSVIESGVTLDLLFTDVVMPGTIRSPDLARLAQQRIANLGVLFTSGYTQNAIVHAGRLDEGVHLLSKPYTQEALARKVREVLATRTVRASGMDNAVGGHFSHSILLCEDDPGIRSTIKDILELKGYFVVDAATAEAAIQACEAVAISLLVTDLKLPGMSGAELAATLRVTRPSLAVVFATGRVDDQAALPVENTIVLLKPYGADTLLEAVALLLA